MPGSRHFNGPKSFIEQAARGSSTAGGAAASDREGYPTPIDEQLRFEQTLADISSALVNVDANEIDKAIADALGRISEALGSDMSTFLQLSPEKGVLQHTHQWIHPDLNFDFHFTDREFNFAQSVPWLTHELRKLEPIVIRRRQDFPESAAKERALAERLGIQSILWVPVAVHGELTACIAFNSMRKESTWPAHLVRRLKVIGDVFTNAVQRARSEQSLAEELAFERLIAELSSTFISLPSEKIDETIAGALGRIGEFMRVDRCFIDQFSDDLSEFRFTHMWTAPGVPQDKLASELLLNDYAPWYTNRMRSNHPVIFTDPDEMPTEAVNEKEYCRRAGIKSSAIVPLFVAGMPIGNFGFDMIRQERSWSEDTLKRLRLASHILSNALKRKRADERLRTAHDEIRALKERLEAENIYLRREIERDYSREGILGNSKAIENVLQQVEQVARTDTTVLISGATGTGKELVASAIHRLSARRDRTLVRVNCAALPSALIEAELFGREKGAYTGALARQLGRFELADGSTLLLDEIGELPIELQAKLLRVLEQGEFERLGGSRTIKVNVRVIAATNHDLERAAREGRFREDLYYRLNVFPITLPPLRDRREDIPLLVWAFIQELSERMGKEIQAIDKSSMTMLQDHDWPGNVRELRNVIERAMIVNHDGTLRVAPLSTRPASTTSAVTLHALERQHIERILNQTRWKISGKQGAAERLGLKSTTLRSKMAKLGIRRPQ